MDGRALFEATCAAERFAVLGIDLMREEYTEAQVGRKGQQLIEHLMDFGFRPADRSPA